MNEWCESTDARGRKKLYRTIPGGKQMILASWAAPPQIYADNGTHIMYFNTYEEAVAWCDEKIGGGGKVYKYKELH